MLTCSTLGILRILWYAFCDCCIEAGAAVAKLADALRSGRSGSNPMEVQVLSAAQRKCDITNVDKMGGM